jgi:phage terminase large subunit-like protein
LPFDLRAAWGSPRVRPQTNERLGPATQAFYDAVVTGRIAHDGDPTLAAHLRNVMAVPLGDHG